MARRWTHRRHLAGYVPGRLADRLRQILANPDGLTRRIPIRRGGSLRGGTAAVAYTRCVPTSRHFGVVPMFERISNGFALAGSTLARCSSRTSTCSRSRSSAASCSCSSSPASPSRSPRWWTGTSSSGRCRQNNNKPPVWVYPVTFAFYFCTLLRHHLLQLGPDLAAP